MPDHHRRPFRQLPGDPPVIEQLAAALGCTVEILEMVITGEVAIAELIGECDAGWVSLTTAEAWTAVSVDDPSRDKPNDRRRRINRSMARAAAAFTSQFVVYRLLGEDLRVIYVGSSRCFDRRIRHHIGTWGEAIADVDATSYPTAAEMLAAETSLIKELQPPLNVTHAGA